MQSADPVCAPHTPLANTTLTPHTHTPSDPHTYTVDVAMSYSIASAGLVTFGSVEQLLITHVLDIVDDIVLMAYRNHARTCAFGQNDYCPTGDSILSHTALAMAAARAVPVVAGARPKRVFVGVETNPDLAPTKLTFGAVPGGKGAAALEVAFKETAEDLGKETEHIRSVVVIGV